MVYGIVSGYFNPIHYGHIEYIHGAKLQCDYLIVIVNNDQQVELKGSSPFMDEDHRMLILQNIKGVDRVVLSIDYDKSVCKTLEWLRSCFPEKELIFFNSGDRQKTNLNPAESVTCRKLNIKEVVLNQPKRYSSSELIRNASFEI